MGTSGESNHTPSLTSLAQQILREMCDTRPYCLAKYDSDVCLNDTCFLKTQMLSEEPYLLCVLHAARHGVRAGAPVRVSPVRGGKLAPDRRMVEREWLHALVPFCRR